MEKPADGEGETAQKKVIDDGPATDAELKLKEETEKAKKELIDQIKGFKTEENDDALLEEEE